MVGLLARPVQMGFVDVGTSFDQVPQGFLGRYCRGIGKQPPSLRLVSPCRYLVGQNIQDVTMYETSR